MITAKNRFFLDMKMTGHDGAESHGQHERNLHIYPPEQC